MFISNFARFDKIIYVFIAFVGNYFNHMHNISLKSTHHGLIVTYVSPVFSKS